MNGSSSLVKEMKLTSDLSDERSFCRMYCIHVLLLDCFLRIRVGWSLTSLILHQEAFQKNGQVGERIDSHNQEEGVVLLFRVRWVALLRCMSLKPEESLVELAHPVPTVVVPTVEDR